MFKHFLDCDFHNHMIVFFYLEIELVEGVFECLNMEAEEYNKIFNFLNDGSFSKGKHTCLSCYYIFIYSIYCK